MADASTKHQQARQEEMPDDPVMQYLNKAAAFAKTYQKQLIAGGVTLLGVIIVIIGVLYFLNRAEEQAAAKLGQSMRQYEAVRVQDGPEALANIKNEFQSLIDEHGYTHAADMALMQYASVSYESGDYDKALELYNAAWDVFEDNSQFNHLILNGLAYSHAAKGHTDKAISYFQKVIDDENAVLKDQALFNLGLLYDQTGNVEKSKAAYERIVSDYPDSVYVQTVEAKLAG